MFCIGWVVSVCDWVDVINNVVVMIMNDGWCNLYWFGFYVLERGLIVDGSEV